MNQNRRFSFEQDEEESQISKTNALPSPSGSADNASEQESNHNNTIKNLNNLNKQFDGSVQDHEKLEETVNGYNDLTRNEKDVYCSNFRLLEANRTCNS
jgi:hypothetical protein|tara:strand:- start:490 stop:786 length:297 start_codon:yes stop_codon:yes gene_type:complete